MATDAVMVMSLRAAALTATVASFLVKTVYGSSGCVVVKIRFMIPPDSWNVKEKGVMASDQLGGGGAWGSPGGACDACAARS